MKKEISLSELKKVANYLNENILSEESHIDAKNKGAYIEELIGVASIVEESDNLPVDILDVLEGIGGILNFKRAGKAPTINEKIEQEPDEVIPVQSMNDMVILGDDEKLEKGVAEVKKIKKSEHKKIDKRMNRSVAIAIALQRGGTKKEIIECAFNIFKDSGGIMNILMTEERFDFVVPALLHLEYLKCADGVYSLVDKKLNIKDVL